MCRQNTKKPKSVFFFSLNELFRIMCCFSLGTAAELTIFECMRNALVESPTQWIHHGLENGLHILWTPSTTLQLVDVSFQWV